MPDNGPAKEHKNEIPITIDRKPFKVTNPVKGSHLYQLGGIADGYELYVHARGNEDDPLITNDEKTYVLEKGDKLYSSEKALNPGQ